MIAAAPAATVKMALPALEPNEGEYLAAIARSMWKDRATEKQLRLLAWWRGNDALRGRRSTGQNVSAQARENNLRDLLRLLDANDTREAMLQAEIHRALGEFDAALGILQRVTAPGSAKRVRRMKSLCDRGITRVVAITST